MSELDLLCRQLAANRFMPVPPEEHITCGDGDYRAIGAEFLGRVVRATGLLPHQRILDIGCGIGRLALPMTQYLDTAGCYDGIDPMAPAIAWCERTITPTYPNVRFRHVDIRHPIYNPGGVLDAATLRLPFEDASFDVISLISVLTHLHEPEVLQLAGEIARLLVPGGRCFATAFLMNAPARAALAAGRGRLGFDAAEIGPIYEATPGVPLAGVAFDEDVLVEKFLRHDLRRLEPVEYGHWSGRDLPSFQDICVFEKV
jgi:SAM-dependent methyltransferase